MRRSVVDEQLFRRDDADDLFGARLAAGDFQQGRKTAPKNVEVVIPTYLVRFRRGGTFAQPGPLKTGE